MCIVSRIHYAVIIENLLYTYVCIVKIVDRNYNFKQTSHVFLPVGKYINSFSRTLKYTTVHRREIVALGTIET